MAEIVSFKLENFKGAKSLKIDLKRHQIFPVVTLLGLNESGKTTILEGLSKFVSEDDTTTDIFRKQHSKDSPSSYIPKHKEAAFTGKISIKADIELDQEDLKNITSALAKEDGKFNIDNISNPLEVEARFTFKDSNFKESRNFWSGINLKYVPKGKRKEVTYTRPSKRDGGTDCWLIIVSTISEKLPKITYFPSFLVDVPERIYLDEYDDEDAINKYYRTVLQDVLDADSDSLSIQKHVVDRLSEYKEENPSEAWLAKFFADEKKKQIDAVFSKLSVAVSREIIGNWARIFQRPTNAKSIVLNWNVDSEKDDLPYASFTITDGESNYEVNQRSLGFRWFFSFLLFTRFRRGQENKTIFLFDEPAANLHAKAQAELLASFAKIVSDGNQIVYSTHSHHMIEPKWLNGAYIIENLAIDYDDTEAIDYFLSRPTEVVATRYRNFLSQSPERSSYYLPALEKLQYYVPKIAELKKLVILEGLSDYNLFRYVAEQNNIENINFIPGVSATNMGPLVSLVTGLSYEFVIVLDDDKAGKDERDRYRKNWSLADEQCMTIGDIHDDFKGKCLESMISSDTRKLIIDHFKIKSRLSKKQIQMYLAESASTGKIKMLTADTEKSTLQAIDLIAKIFPA